MPHGAFARHRAEVGDTQLTGVIRKNLQEIYYIDYKTREVSFHFVKTKQFSNEGLVLPTNVT